jgi:5-methylcytosine-specific restriction endonuclease McrA
LNSPKPKKRPWQIQSDWKPRKQTRKHTNKKFYNSTAWRKTRTTYLERLQKRVWKSALRKVWKLPSAEIELSEDQASYLLSLPFIPCETCVKLYLIGHYTKVDEAKELDHIDPVNPDNALESKGWGNPFDSDNLQFLCRKHHARKSNRDKKLIQAKRK